MSPHTDTVVGSLALSQISTGLLHHLVFTLASWCKHQTHSVSSQCLTRDNTGTLNTECKRLERHIIMWQFSGLGFPLFKGQRSGMQHNTKGWWKGKMWMVMSLSDFSVSLCYKKLVELVECFRILWKHCCCCVLSDRWCLLNLFVCWSTCMFSQDEVCWTLMTTVASWPRCWI